MHWLYLLKSDRNRTCYIGTTSNLQLRIRQHKQGLSQATKNGCPWKLVYLEGYVSKEDALTRERRLKQYGQALSRLKKRLKHSFELTL